MKTKENLFYILFMILAAFQITGCSKDDELKVQVLEAEGYVIGYHPCVGNITVTTSKGEGKGYLVATTNAKPDTLMVYGVPVGMFDIPDEWFSRTGGYLLPVEGRKTFKMRFSYQVATEKEKIGLQYACNAMYPLPDIKYLKPEYIVVTTEKTQ